MEAGFFRSFARDERGAISSLYAVGILALVAIAGVGFDYGRMMALDTELQNAADQSALAAATQLDGSDGAMARARAAAINALGNQTRFANDRDADGRNLSIPSANVEFFDGYANDTFGSVATTDDAAKVVQVTVSPRRVFYALTPLVDAFSGRATGKAAAMLQTATCNVPPMMFCVPNGADGNPRRDFPTSDDIGHGLALHFKANGVSSNPSSTDATQTDTTVWAPGDFGFLDMDYYPKSGQNSTAGVNSYALGCTGTPPVSNPGFRTPQGTALNTRFDLYGTPKKSCDSSTGDFCPSPNVTKNWINVQTVTVTDPSTATCASTPPNKSTWRPYDASTDSSFSNPGYPLDASYSGPYGDGNWSPSTWISAAHPGNTLDAIPDLDGNGEISRYEAYEWEMGDPANLLKPRLLHSDPPVASNGNSGKWDVTLYCSYPQPVNATGFPASDSEKDRRVMSVAAVDCSSLNGKEAVDIVRWVDLFLVQPVNTTAEDRNFQTEIIGPARQANGNSGFQYFGKRKAVLIR
ncbi:pilus assembly protein TadG-related protein [Novosphingobium sp. ZN18A2]|uniref:TadE/TadG family type IV pilus assembly protein n=1 Tax=Novosphingobium sp. ZN18A2 TaxID=3079861 RepID=UPI0030D33E6F